MAIGCLIIPKVCERPAHDLPHQVMDLLLNVHGKKLVNPALLVAVDDGGEHVGQITIRAE